MKQAIITIITVLALAALIYGGYILWNTYSARITGSIDIGCALCKEINIVFSPSEDDSVYTATSNPTIVALDDGSYRMYMNEGVFDSEAGTVSKNTILTAHSEDGIEFEIDGDLGFSAPTPRIAKFDGMFVLFYTNKDTNAALDRFDIFGAISDDGINFTQGTRPLIEPRDRMMGVSGPTLYELPNGIIRMLFDERTPEDVEEAANIPDTIWGASSFNGLDWSRDKIVTLDHGETGDVRHPFVLKYDKGYIMFYNFNGYNYVATSLDGIEFIPRGFTGICGSSLDGIVLSDGTIRLYFDDVRQNGNYIFTALIDPVEVIENAGTWDYHTCTPRQAE